MEDQGYRLDGAIIKEFQDVDLHGCYKHCFDDSSCKSVNIESGGYGICQLNNASSYDVMDSVFLSKDSKWDFHSTNFSDRLVCVQFLI